MPRGDSLFTSSPPLLQADNEKSATIEKIKNVLVILVVIGALLVINWLMPYLSQRTAFMAAACYTILFQFLFILSQVFSFAVSAVSRVLIPTKPPYASHLRRNINVARTASLCDRS